MAKKKANKDNVVLDGSVNIKDNSYGHELDFPEVKLSDVAEENLINEYEMQHKQQRKELYDSFENNKLVIILSTVISTICLLGLGVLTIGIYNLVVTGVYQTKIIFQLLCGAGLFALLLGLTIHIINDVQKMLRRLRGTR